MNALYGINDADSERIEYLGSLFHSAELQISGKLVRLFHAHPLHFNRYFPDSPIEQRLELFHYDQRGPGIKRQADVAIYGDIHIPYLQTLNGKILVNTDSVGNPLDIKQASYVILEGEECGDKEALCQILTHM